MISRKTRVIAGTVLILSSLALSVVWFTFRIYVPHNKCAVLIRRMGDELPSGQKIASHPKQKGIQLEVLGPGRHFRNPLWYDHEIVSQTVVPSGDPATWEWVHSLDEHQREELRAGTFRFQGDFPKIGIVTRKVGNARPADQVLVSRESGMEGILEEVLTPGVYKLNPYVYDVSLHPATVIPAGFVGVVTNLFGDQPASFDDAPTSGEDVMTNTSRPLAQADERGIQSDVLQPGVYFVNPKKQKITLIEIGFNEYSQIKLSEAENYRIAFPSDTGFVIKVGVTVVWGIDPAHAADIINEFGNVDRVLDKVIGPQLRSISRNIGSTYSARDFIQGEKRERFQLDLTGELHRVCSQKNIEILLALIREIEVHAPSKGPDGGEVTEDLKRTIQQSFIALESQTTKAKQREAASVKAQLEEARKKIDIAQESIRAETRILVGGILADAAKQAAEIDAQADLEVATIDKEIALLDAQKTEILGRANATAMQLANDAEARGYEMLVQAFGSGDAFNLYTFAEHFHPESIQMIFAGEGTLWTDLKSFQNVSAAKIIEQASYKGVAGN